jgi:hypothetical protein
MLILKGITMKKIILLGTLLTGALLSASEGEPIPFAEDRIMAAIIAMDPVKTSQFLMPGFFVSEKQRREYILAARKVTNETFMELDQYGFGDIACLLSGITKTVLGAGTLWYIVPEFLKNSPQVPTDIAGTQEIAKKISVGLCGLCAVALGMQDLSMFGTMYQRYVDHHNALAVEAIIQRLPVCTEIIKSSPSTDNSR